MSSHRVVGRRRPDALAIAESSIVCGCGPVTSEVNTALTASNGDGSSRRRRHCGRGRRSDWAGLARPGCHRRTRKWTWRRAATWRDLREDGWVRVLHDAQVAQCRFGSRWRASCRRVLGGTAAGSVAGEPRGLRRSRAATWDRIRFRMAAGTGARGGVPDRGKQSRVRPPRVLTGLC